jgi:hypothetical protein
MLHLPNDLYNCLKVTLSKEASSATLEEYLPLIRDIILKLLQGLKKKQFLLRERQQLQHSISIPLLSPSSSTSITTTAANIDNNSKKTVTISKSLESPKISPIHHSFVMNDNMIALYLKMNDRVKKINVDRSIINDLNSIKSLFIDKFHIQQEESTIIWILDNESNIEYELEDLSDIKPFTIISIKKEGKKRGRERERECVCVRERERERGAAVDRDRDTEKEYNSS